MKRMIVSMVVILFSTVLMMAGCGGGGGGTTGSTTSTFSNNNSITPVPPVAPPIAVTETVKVSNLYPANAGSYGATDYVNYYYQVAKPTDIVTVGFNAYGNCGGYGAARSALGGGSGYAPCSFPGVPVSFRIWNGNVQLGPVITVPTDENSMALAEVDLSTLGLTVTSGSVKTLTVNASVDDGGYVVSGAWPNVSAKIDVVPSDFVANYSAKVDQDTTVTVVAGDTYYGFGSGYVRVKNTGNIPWYSMSNPLKRVYMVTQNTTGSVFFKDSWYDANVVSDVSSYTDVMPGDTTELYYSLSGKNVTVGDYRECFKLETMPISIAQDWNHYTLVDPIEVTGSEFCINIKVIPPSLERKTASESSVTTDIPYGKLFWEAEAQKR